MHPPCPAMKQQQLLLSIPAGRSALHETGGQATKKNTPDYPGGRGFCGKSGQTCLRRFITCGSTTRESGRGSCRERVCQYVWISVVAVSITKKLNITTKTHRNK